MTSDNKRMQIVFALIAGTLFGLGLAISGMVNPAKVIAFLDVAGAWDPTLAFVMLGAVVVTALVFHGVVKRRARPWFAENFVLPTLTGIDLRLVIGAVMFGVGWGLVGLCPGPALTALVTLQWKVWVFVGAMLAGVALHTLWDRSPR